MQLCCCKPTVCRFDDAAVHLRHRRMGDERTYHIHLIGARAYSAAGVHSISCVIRSCSLTFPFCNQVYLDNISPSKASDFEWELGMAKSPNNQTGKHDCGNFIAGS